MAGGANRRRFSESALIVGLALLASLLVVPPARAAQDYGTSGPTYSGVANPPTSDKPQSKLWWNDGSWWAYMWVTNSGWHIERLDRGVHQWVDTGVLVDPRSNALGDTLWDGQHLYIASQVAAVSTNGSPTLSKSGNKARLYRYSYRGGTYTLDSGFPTIIGDYSTESLTIDEDSTGRLWATWTQVSGDSTAGYTSTVYVNVSSVGGTSWQTPFVIPTDDPYATADDIAAVVAFQRSKIGVMWSDQSTGTVWWAWRNDGTSFTDPSSWHAAPAIRGPNQADDHLNLKTLQSDIRDACIASVKTSLDDTGAPQLEPAAAPARLQAWDRILQLHHDLNACRLPDPAPGRAEQRHQPGQRVHDGPVHLGVRMPVLRLPRGDLPEDHIDGQPLVRGRPRNAGHPGRILGEREQRHVQQAAGGCHDRHGGPCLEPLDQAVLVLRRAPMSTPSAPVASFTATPTSGVAPLAVTFTDTSTGSPTSWSWDFGDGTAVSTQQSPSHTYSTAGSFTVTLTATNATGSNTVTTTNAITVSTPPAPVASFTATPTSGVAPLAVTFTDTSTGSPTSWSWDFGDGTAVSTQQSPSHTYSTAGSFTVTLTATNATGSNTVTTTNAVTVSTPPAPVASFTATPTSGVAPLAVAFTDTSTGSPTSWSWDFGDGTAVSTQQSPSHTYSTAGSFTVTLTATNATGSNTVTTTNAITVSQGSWSGNPRRPVRPPPPQRSPSTRRPGWWRATSWSPRSMRTRHRR